MLQGILYAVKYLSDRGKDKNIPIGRIMEGNESKEFWNVFDGVSITNLVFGYVRGVLKQCKMEQDLPIDIINIIVSFRM